MDVDPNPRKYAPHPPYQGQNGSSSKPYGSGRSSRGREDPEEGNRNPRSSRSSSHGTSGRPRHPQQPSGSHYSRQGPTSAPNAMQPSTQHFTPPGPHYGHRQMDNATPPPEAVQPTYPPPAVTQESPPPSEQSQRRPAYLLHRDLVIGKGSYGQVCIASRGEAEGHSSGRSGKRKKFACKCVMLRNDPKYISKLQEEVNVLRELRGHDNVIRLYDVFCVDNELFIITELGRGGDLFHLLTTHPKHGVTEAYAAKTVAEMLSSVAFLHSKNICHRDLKLENWVLESGKDVWSPLKLIDFGLSTHFSPGQRLSRVVGSSYYVAPEVLKKSYTEACDLWSLGVIVYMLLSGAPPFYGKNDEAIKASIVQGEYTFPHELFRDVSDEAMAFVSTLLSYNIEYRYTAEQALTHPWLAANCDPDTLQRTKDGARGVGIVKDTSRSEPMQF
jgi:calcium/calmodulin-dependent protein kinase I